MQTENSEEYSERGMAWARPPKIAYETEIHKIPRKEFFSEINSMMGPSLAQQITFPEHKKMACNSFWFTNVYCIYDVAGMNHRISNMRHLEKT